MTFEFGIDKLLRSPAELAQLKSQRCALVAHPASVTTGMMHSLDALYQAGCQIACAFGPQHGMRGDKQDNMIESADYQDPVHGIPVVSLYGDHRRPTPEMLAGLDIILFDLQDIGCRIYTYIATLKYFVEACAEADIALWVLDRPNPAGRPADGLLLESGQESFVGSDILPARHGLTIGEIAVWFKETNQLKTRLTVISMTEYEPVNSLEHGWPDEIAWVNPSPNASSVNMARCFPGTVLLEGTQLSEGRGTTIPLEVIGAPDFPVENVLALLNDTVPAWLAGVQLRPCYFEPTFHKYLGQLCAGIQIHTGFREYDHEAFKPYRLIAGCLKALRILHRDYPIWRDFYYEYEQDRLPIDVINGGSALRNWIDDPDASFDQFDQQIQREIDTWIDERRSFLIY